MNIFKFFTSLLVLFFFLNIVVYAEKVVYLDMDKIMRLSKAGKVAIEKINNQKKKDVNKFRKIEEDLKAQETDLINKKNWLLDKFFILRLESFKNVYNLYNKSCFKSSTIVLYALKFE